MSSEFNRFIAGRVAPIDSPKAQPGSAALRGEHAGAKTAALRRAALLFGIPLITFLAMRCLLVALTGLPLIPPHVYSFDNVNQALALDDFDPTRNQPQPPGYPLFVMEERVMRVFFHTPERTFFAMETMLCSIAVAMLFLLAQRMFSDRTAWFAAALLFVNPALWFSLLTSPLRPHLAVVSLVMAYFCWRAGEGNIRYFFAASLALGIGSGFRPELLLMLSPLWLWAVWGSRAQFMQMLTGACLVAASALTWILLLAHASHGLINMFLSFSGYGLSQTQQTSILFDPRASTWLRWAGRGVLWNALGALPWIWTVPYAWRERKTLSDRRRISTFLAIWFLPAFAFHMSIHIGEPDQALNTIPIVCLIGGFCVAAAERALSQKKGWMPEWKQKKAIPLWIALGGNLLIFFGQFPVPQHGPSSGFRGLQSLEDSVLIGTYETSYARIRWVNQMMGLAVDELKKVRAATTRPVIVVWARDGEPVWRKLSFYVPDQRMISLDDAGDPAVPIALAQVWTNNHREAKYGGTAPIQVPVPKNARLVWLIGSASVGPLMDLVPLQKAPPLYYTDLPENFTGFHWGSFQFVPEEPPAPLSIESRQ